MTDRPEPAFEAPWHAQLFAMTVALNEAGHFSWSRWAEVFGPMVQTVDAALYWDVWSEALVVLLADLGVAEADEVASLARAWQEAARATPHGEPITLP